MQACLLLSTWCPDCRGFTVVIRCVHTYIQCAATHSMYIPYHVQDIDLVLGSVVKHHAYVLCTYVCSSCSFHPRMYSDSSMT